MLTADRFPRSGKVRDLHRIEDGRLLLVASDRISAFDVVLPTPIPDKGRVLTGLSRFWFRETAGIIANHLLDVDPAIIVDAYAAQIEANPEVPIEVGPRADAFEAWRGRVMVCRPAIVLPIEAVVRGYLSGSGWKEYQATGEVCGVPLPPGLRESDALPEPIFTPAEKAPAGHHDRNITFDEMIDHLGGQQGEPSWLGLGEDQAKVMAERIRDVSIRLYRYGAAVAARNGIVLADTKFEFGIPTDLELWSDPSGPPAEQIMRRRPLGTVPDTTGGAHTPEGLIQLDEILTPDSSRFWDTATYQPGRPQASFDKQFVRDWLEGQPWDKTAPGPDLPPDIVEGTRARYIEAFERITGASFDRYLKEDVIAR